MGIDAPRIAWAEAQDAPVLHPLMRALYAHDVPDAPAPTPETVSTHLDLLLDPGTPHRLAIASDADDVPLGLSAVAIFASVNDPRPDNWVQMELKELFVMPEARGQGVGEALMNRATEHAREVGASRLDLLTGKDNTVGQSLYEKLGYERSNEGFYSYSLELSQ